MASPAPDTPEEVAAPANRLAIDLLDVFVYVVVLNLAVQYVPSVLAENFTISLLTAVLLKVVLEAVVAVKNRVKRRFHEAVSPPAKVVAALMLWAVLVGSKFLVLELTALVFGDRVSLGGFFPVTGLILVLLLSRAAVRRLLTPAHGGDRSTETPRVDMPSDG